MRDSVKGDWNFRVRFRIRDGFKIGASHKATALILSTGIDCTLESCNGSPISSSQDLSITGKNFATEHAANRVGSRVMHAIVLWAFEKRVPVDLGWSIPKGFISDTGMARISELLSEPNEKRTLQNDKLGLTVFEGHSRFFNPPTASVLSVYAGFSSELSAIEASISQKDFIELPAIEIYFASLFHEVDISFLLQVVAIESMIEQRDLSSEAIEFVYEVLSQLGKNPKIPSRQKSSLIGRINYLKKESIRQAGMRFCQEALPCRQYSKMEGSEFFDYIYSLRSSFVHGKDVQATRTKIVAISESCNEMCRDLIKHKIDTV